MVSQSDAGRFNAKVTHRVVPSVVHVNSLECPKVTTPVLGIALPETTGSVTVVV